MLLCLNELFFTWLYDTSVSILFEVVTNTIIINDITSLASIEHILILFHYSDFLLLLLFVLNYFLKNICGVTILVAVTLVVLDDALEVGGNVLLPTLPLFSVENSVYLLLLKTAVVFLL